MPAFDSVVAIYHTQLEADQALTKLQGEGIDMRNLSIVGRDHLPEEQVVAYYNVGYRMKRWEKAGSFWGGFWKNLSDSAFFTIPGIGPLLVAGPLVAWIVGSLNGQAVVSGLTALGAGLLTIGIPEKSVLQYELAVKRDDLVMIVHGTKAEIGRATKVLETTQGSNLTLHAKGW